MGCRKVLLQRDRAAERGGRTSQIALGLQHAAEGIVCVGIVRFEFDCRAQRVSRPIEVALVPVDEGGFDERPGRGLRVAGVAGDEGLLDELLRGARVSALPPHVSIA